MYLFIYYYRLQNYLDIKEIIQEIQGALLLYLFAIVEVNISNTPEIAGSIHTITNKFCYGLRFSRFFR